MKSIIWRWRGASSSMGDNLLNMRPAVKGFSSTPDTEKSSTANGADGERVSDSCESFGRTGNHMILLVLHTALAHSSYRPAPLGDIVVTNRSGGTVTVALSGQPGVRLSPWATSVLRGPAGESTLRAS